MQEIKPYETMNYESGDIGIDEVQITYIQNADCTEDNDDVQSITLVARNNGIARFVNIKTESWSISHAGEMENLILDFERRAGIFDMEPKRNKPEDIEVMAVDKLEK